MRNGPVVQLVRTPACHAGGRRFEPVSGRHFADIAQSVECILGKDEVTGSNPVISSTCKPLNLGVWRFFLLRENRKKRFCVTFDLPHIVQTVQKVDIDGVMPYDCVGLKYACNVY